jgi:hypothetical protein
VRKRFPQKVGLGLVIGAAVAFLILAARRETFFPGGGGADWEWWFWM